MGTALKSCKTMSKEARPEGQKCCTQTLLLKTWDAKNKLHHIRVKLPSWGLLEFVAYFYLFFPHPSDHCGTHHFTFASLMPNSITHLSISSKASVFARSLGCVIFLFLLYEVNGQMYQYSQSNLSLYIFGKTSVWYHSRSRNDMIQTLSPLAGATKISQLRGIDQLPQKIHGSVHIDLTKTLCNPSKTRGRFGLFACPPCTMIERLSLWNFPLKHDGLNLHILFILERARI